MPNAANDLTSELTNTSRLESLYNANLLDTPDEKSFDRITGLVRQFLKVPVSLVSMVDFDRQFIKSQAGLPKSIADARNQPLSHSICKHVIQKQNILSIDDAAGNTVICDNKAVSDYGVMAYLGAPLASKGQIIGSLCAIDLKPRQWTEEDQTILQDMAHFAMLEIALRQKIRRWS